MSFAAPKGNYTATASSAIAVAVPDRQRKSIWLKNLGPTDDISLAFGVTAVDQEGIVLGPGEGTVIDSNRVGEYTLQQAVYAIRSGSASPILAYHEFY